MQYAISSKGIAHIIKDHPDNGLCGHWMTICGNEFRPVKIVDSIPDKTKVCRICKKHWEVL